MEIRSSNCNSFIFENFTFVSCIFNCDVLFSACAAIVVYFKGFWRELAGKLFISNLFSLENFCVLYFQLQ